MKDDMINQYTCPECGGVITTVHVDHGVTPMFLACRATKDCIGSMVSSMYRVDQTLQADYEWYRPKTMPFNRGLRQHVQMGGLLIRKRQPKHED